MLEPGSRYIHGPSGLVFVVLSHTFDQAGEVYQLRLDADPSGSHPLFRWSDDNESRRTLVELRPPAEIVGRISLEAQLLSDWSPYNP